MRQPDIRPDYSQERLEEALRLDAAANVGTRAKLPS